MSGSSPCTLTTWSKGSLEVDDRQRSGNAIGARLKVARRHARRLPPNDADVIGDAVVVGGDVDGAARAAIATARS